MFRNSDVERSARPEPGGKRCYELYHIFAYTV
jgi:hypothetical protein